MQLGARRPRHGGGERCRVRGRLEGGRPPRRFAGARAPQAHVTRRSQRVPGAQRHGVQEEEKAHLRWVFAGVFAPCETAFLALRGVPTGGGVSGCCCERAAAWTWVAHRNRCRRAAGSGKASRERSSIPCPSRVTSSRLHVATPRGGQILCIWRCRTGEQQPTKSCRTPRAITHLATWAAVAVIGVTAEKISSKEGGISGNPPRSASPAPRLPRRGAARSPGPQAAAGGKAQQSELRRASQASPARSPRARLGLAASRGTDSLRYDRRR